MAPLRSLQSFAIASVRRAQFARSTTSGRVQPSRLVIESVVAGMAALAVVVIVSRAHAGQYGSDFHGGMWSAGRAVLAGHSPYGPAIPSVLRARQSAFIPPPPLALIAVPFAALPFPLAVTLWSAVCCLSFWAALRLTGMRDRDFLLLAFCSYPFIASLLFGQPDGVLALLLALSWRYRDGRGGAVAVGGLIALKLIAWPLVLWLLVTRRTRSAVTAVGACVLALLASWAVIGFAGLTSYPRLLDADAHAFAARSYSVFAEVIRAGGTAGLAQLLCVVAGLAVALAAMRRGGRRDLSIFAAAFIFGLFASPLLELSYLASLFVLLAIPRSRVDGLALSTSVLWLTMPGLLPGLDWVQVGICLFIMSLIAIRVTPVDSSEAARHAGSTGSTPQPCRD